MLVTRYTPEELTSMGYARFPSWCITAFERRGVPILMGTNAQRSPCGPFAPTWATALTRAMDELLWGVSVKNVPTYDDFVKEAVLACVRSDDPVAYAAYLESVLRVGGYSALEDTLRNHT